MRFANTTGALASAAWVTYSSEPYSWNLDSALGNKTVYVQFSGANGILREAQDTIYLDSPVDSNLKVLLDGAMNGTNILDRTSNANNFTGFGSITTSTINNIKGFSFNGTNQYMERT